MRTLATTVLLTCALLVSASPLQAQDQPREDYLWALTAPDQDFVLDGVLDEAAWDDAQSIQLEYGEGVFSFPRDGFPGSGYRPIGGIPEDEVPVDPVNATIKFLTKGNQLWIGVEVEDESIGGTTSIFRADGIHFMIFDRTNFAAGDAGWSTGPTNRAEHFYTWWNPADTTDQGEPMPGIEPRFFGGGDRPHGSAFGEGIVDRTDEQEARWNASTTVDGTVNDDSGDPDVGYVMEHRIDLASYGYDLTQEGGDAVMFAITVEDADYQWPVDDSRDWLSFTWWQNQWGNNWNEGTAILLADPSVTVSSPDPEPLGPDQIITNGSNYSPPTIDGNLDEEVWEAVHPALTLKYGDTDLRELVPGIISKWQTGWFRSDLNERAPTIVDTSTATFKWFHRGDTLYVGVDVADQAVNGIIAEDGRDGIRLALNARDTVQTDQTPIVQQFEIAIDSSGTDSLLAYAAALNDPLGDDYNPDAMAAEVSLKGTSTAADPSDVDEGYQIEIAIDLPEALGYSEDLGDRYLFLSAVLFDGDAFEDFENDYATRTWFRRERGTNDGNGTGMVGYLATDVFVGTGIDDDDVAGIPSRIKILGNYPNPFNPATTVQYQIANSSQVMLRIFDVLGRQVAVHDVGVQKAGTHEYRLDASNLASGVYLYSVQSVDQATGDVNASAAGRMILMK